MKNQNKIQFLILGLLWQMPMSGYQLKKQMDVSLANFISPSFGNIYPTLKTLETSNYIEAEVDREGHKKIIYQITPTGQTYFLSWLKSDPDEAFLAREYFMGFLTADERVQLFQKYVEKLKAQWHHLKTIEENYHDVMGKYPLHTLQYGLNAVEAEITWYEARIKGEIS